MDIYRGNNSVVIYLIEYYRQYFLSCEFCQIVWRHLLKNLQEFVIVRVIMTQSKLFSSKNGFKYCFISAVERERERVETEKILSEFYVGSTLIRIWDE